MGRQDKPKPEGNFWWTGKPGENHGPRTGRIGRDLGPVSGTLARRYQGKPGGSVWADGARTDARRPRRSAERPPAKPRGGWRA
jgi:hypothetical protein